MDRHQVAGVLDECGTLLELKGENPFRSNAYHNAARAVQQLEGNLDELVEKGGLSGVKGLGAAMIEKIGELVRTGKLEFHENLKKEVPHGLVEMLRIQGFGPKRIKHAYEELGIDTIDKLRAACADGRLAGLKGFGEKTARKILDGLAFLDKAGQRVLYPVAMAAARPILEALADHPAVRKIELCGSLRRAAPTIKDVDVLVASGDPEPIMERFTSLPGVRQVTSKGTTRSSVVLEGGIAADLRVVSEEQFPFALHYFTGSKAHNVAVRGLAQDKGLKLNEYELAGDKKKIPCKDEAAIYEALGLEYIPPELRENTGEIEAAAKGELPELIGYDDLTGCFHCHTTYSDGLATLAQMVAGAKKAGLAYLGIADHSKTAAYAKGLSVQRVHEQHAEIDRLAAGEKKFRIYKGIESDILADGSLDYDEETLASFDYVVASIHSPLGMNEKAMTERVVRAIRHPRCTMLGHPTGRLLLQREGFPIDLETVLKEAVRHGVMIEINAHPMRLDLDWIFCKRAKALGVTLVINPDAHAVSGFGDLRYGIAVARRGWLEAKNVFNTRKPADVAKALEARRKRASATA